MDFKYYHDNAKGAADKTRSVTYALVIVEIVTIVIVATYTEFNWTKYRLTRAAQACNCIENQISIDKELGKPLVNQSQECEKAIKYVSKLAQREITNTNQVEIVRQVYRSEMDTEIRNATNAFPLLGLITTDVNNLGLASAIIIIVILYILELHLRSQRNHFLEAKNQILPQDEEREEKLNLLRNIQILSSPKETTISLVPLAILAPIVIHCFIFNYEQNTNEAMELLIDNQPTIETLKALQIIFLFATLVISALTFVTWRKANEVLPDSTPSQTIRELLTNSLSFLPRRAIARTIISLIFFILMAIAYTIT